MAVAKSFNNKNFSIPVNGDRNWGKQASDFLIEVATAALSKAGGNFTLTADVNFGANYGLIAKYLKSVSANIAETGVVRLANNEGIGFRNAANNADLLLKVNASDKLEFNGTAVITTTDFSSKLDKTQNLENLSTTISNGVSGFLQENAVGLFEKRTLVATSPKVVIVNGNGNAGNPGFDISESNINIQSLGGALSTAQLTDKLITRPNVDLFMDFDHESDPAAPAAGKTRVYGKTDGKLYQITSDAVVKQLGGGGLEGKEVAANISPAVNGTMYEYGTLSAPRTLTLPTGTTAFVIGVIGSATTTNYLDVIPGSGTIEGAADTDRYRYSRFNAVYYRAEGSSDIKVARQATTIIQPGFQSGYPGTFNIGPTFVGQVLFASPAANVNAPGSAQYFDCCFLDLPAGLWACSGKVAISRNGATWSATDNVGGFGLTTGNNGPTFGSTNDVNIAPSTFTEQQIVIATAIVRSDGSNLYNAAGQNLNGSGVATPGIRLYLKGYCAVYTAGTPFARTSASYPVTATHMVAVRIA